MNAFPNELIDIVGIGASTLDRFIVVDHFPTGREVQEAISSTTDGGGPVATALATAGKYGSRTVMIDRIGDDMVGRYILEDFHKYNVNTEGIQIDADAKSGTATILVKQKTGERAVFFERSTASNPEFLDKYQGLIENASIVHINGRHRHLMRTAIDIARQSGTIISLDGGAQRYDDDMRPITESSHVVIVARDYAEKYTGATNLEEACCIIHDHGALIAGVTDGANGSYFVWPDGTAFRCQPFPQASVVDTTGAGDSFHGAFLSKLAVSIRQENALYGEFIKPIDILQSLDHKQLESAAIFASAVSALNTQGVGGRSALPSLKSACNLAGLE